MFKVTKQTISRAIKIKFSGLFKCFTETPQTNRLHYLRTLHFQKDLKLNQNLKF